MKSEDYLDSLRWDLLDLPANPYHPLVHIKGDVTIGEGGYIGMFTVIHGVGSKITIGKNFDCAPFVSINVADSHRKTLGLAKEIERLPITIGDNVFVGTRAIIKGGVMIGNNCVIAAGAIVEKRMVIPNWTMFLADGKAKEIRH